MKLLFPTILIILDLGAAAVYGYYGDWRQTLYWFSAAVLSACVVY